MARSLTTDEKIIFSSDAVLKCELVELLFETPMRLTNAGQNIQWGGYTWIGDGTLLSISPIRENIGLQAHGAQVELSGVDGALVSFALNGYGKGKVMKVYVAVFDEEEGEWIAVLESRLRIDTMVVVDGGKESA